MNKISKIIICCIAVIISIVSLCVPTYCADYSFSVVSWESLNNNFYNSSNSSYVKYNNLQFAVDYTENKSYMSLVGTFNNSVSLPYYFTDSFSVYGSKKENGEYSELRVKFNMVLTYNFQYNFSIDSYEIVKNDWFIDFNDARLYTLNFYYQPFVMDHLFTNVSNYIIKSYFSYIFDIEYSNQYFYNEYFGLNLFFTQNYSINHPMIIDFIDNNNNFFIYNSTISDYYTNYRENESVYDYKRVLLLRNYFNYENSYIKSIKMRFTGSWGRFTLRDNTITYPENFVQLNALATGSYSNTYCKFIYSSYYPDSEYSALIPNGSNDYYKTAEWWDIPAHLYNFFIYLVFDAPIISNFTSLVMIIINFIVEVFDFFIGLFTGINNIFFISIFLGIIVLIFLLKIIFKG